MGNQPNLNEPDAMADVPVKRPEGATVIKIGDLRIARGRAKREKHGCRHLDITYDPQERRIWCDACEMEVEAFDVVESMARFVGDSVAALERRAAELREAEAFAVRRRATKALDEVWRGKMLPCCVECGAGMFPEDYTSVGTRVGREYAEAQRKRRTTNRK